MKLNEPFLFLKHNNGICDLLCTDDFNLLGGLNVTVRAFSRFFALFATLSVVRYIYIFFFAIFFSSPRFYCLDFFVSFVLRHS